MLKTAFSYTLSKLNSWPVIRTDNLLDYALADQFANKAPYVWLVETNAAMRDDFNWNFRPEFREKNLIHNFPRCDSTNKHPISWNTCKLVPTFAPARIPQEIRRREIASYSSNMFPCYIYGLSDFNTIKKVQEKRYKFKYNIIRTKNSMLEIYRSINPMISESHIWLIDVDVDVSLKFELDFRPKDTNTIYIFNTKNLSAGVEYPDGSVKLVPISYILAKQANLLVKELASHENMAEWKNFSCFPVEVVYQCAGSMNDATNPMSAWIRSFNRAVNFSYNFSYLDNKFKDEILDKAMKSDLSLKEYISTGTSAGLSYYEKNKDFSNRLELTNDFSLLGERFKRVQEVKSTRKMLNDNKQKIDTLTKNVFGEEGVNEYKKDKDNIKKYRAN